MKLRILMVWAGIVLAGSGALMYAASWQRWGRVCSWGADMSGGCASRQDHVYDFLPPTDPWVPVGDAAELAGSSLLVFALALPLLPWVMTGRRPGAFSAVALVAAELALVAVGVATLRSGLAGEVVEPVPSALAGALWLLIPPFLFGRLAVGARGWARAAAVMLVLASPMVAMPTYAIGPFDAQPWWEGLSGAFSAVAGLCLLVAAARTRPPAAQEAPAEVAVLPGVDA